MSFPNLPAEYEDPWYTKFINWATNVQNRIAGTETVANAALPLKGTLGTADLNTILVEGDYHQGVPANATLANNYPQASMMCTVSVRRRENSDSVVQTLRPIGSFAGAGRGVFERIRVAAAWQEWRFTPSQRVNSGSSVGRAFYTWDHVNNREQLLSADTGWRDISSLVDASKWKDTVKVCMLRRVGYECDFVFRMVASATPLENAGDVLLFPFGFRGNIDTLPLMPVYFGPDITTSSKLGAVRAGPTTTGSLSFWNGYGGSVTPLVDGDTLGFRARWTTSDPWPTTLPGSAIGSIPNA